MRLTTIKLKAPYLIFFGDVSDPLNAKTGLGIAQWATDRCAGQLRFPECAVDCDLPHLGIPESLAAGVRTVIVGVAPVGGRLQDNWIPTLAELARAGVDIASGLHSKLSDAPQLVESAKAGGATLIDVRVPPTELPVGLGRKRTGKRVLTVGTDCAVGKKYTALALHRELARRGLATTFRATGQTGIMIAGEGVPIDSVVADFISGAAEALSPDNDDEHWDIIEGQGSLVNPSYAGVTLGLLHGSQPDAIVLCHEAGRQQILEVENGAPIPPLGELVEYVLTAARLTNPACTCAGVSVNTSKLGDEQRADYLAGIQDELGVPAVDPIATGVQPIADLLLR